MNPTRVCIVLLATLLVAHAGPGVRLPATVGNIAVPLMPPFPEHSSCWSYMALFGDGAVSCDEFMRTVFARKVYVATTITEERMGHLKEVFDFDNAQETIDALRTLGVSRVESKTYSEVKDIADATSEEVMKRLTEGDSVILHYPALAELPTGPLHESDPKHMLRTTAHLGGLISQAFGGVDASLNVYMSGPGSAALNPHTDRYDAVIVQLHGSKRWTVCHPKASQTLKDIIGEEAAASLSPAALADVGEVERHQPGGCTQYTEKELENETNYDCQEIVLVPGNVMYMPKGMIHIAKNEHDSEVSAHATLGIQRFVSHTDLTYGQVLLSFIDVIEASSGSRTVAKLKDVIINMDGTHAGIGLSRLFPTWAVRLSCDHSTGLFCDLATSHVAFPIVQQSVSTLLDGIVAVYIHTIEVEHANDYEGRGAIDEARLTMHAAVHQLSTPESITGLLRFVKTMMEGTPLRDILKKYEKTSDEGAGDGDAADVFGASADAAEGPRTLASCESACTVTLNACEDACSGLAPFKTKACDGTCTRSCDARPCFKGCDHGCTNGCDDKCVGSCDSGGRCTGSCDSGCTRGCDRSWGRSCDSGCTKSCDSKCGHHKSCDSKCVGSCDSGCKTSCDESCTQGCDDGCSTSCDEYDMTLVTPCKNQCQKGYDGCVDGCQDGLKFGSAIAGGASSLGNSVARAAADIAHAIADCLTEIADNLVADFPSPDEIMEIGKCATGGVSGAQKLLGTFKDIFNPTDLLNTLKAGEISKNQCQAVFDIFELSPHFSCMKAVLHNLPLPTGCGLPSIEDATMGLGIAFSVPTGFVTWGMKMGIWITFVDEGCYITAEAGYEVGAALPTPEADFDAFVDFDVSSLCGQSLTGSMQGTLFGISIEASVSFGYPFSFGDFPTGLTATGGVEANPIAAKVGWHFGSTNIRSLSGDTYGCETRNLFVDALEFLSSGGLLNRRLLTVAGDLEIPFHSHWLSSYVTTARSTYKTARRTQIAVQSAKASIVSTADAYARFKNVTDIGSHPPPPIVETASETFLDRFYALEEQSNEFALASEVNYNLTVELMEAHPYQLDNSSEYLQFVRYLDVDVRTNANMAHDQEISTVAALAALSEIIDVVMDFTTSYNDSVSDLQADDDALTIGLNVRDLIANAAESSCNSTLFSADVDVASIVDADDILDTLSVHYLEPIMCGSSQDGYKTLKTDMGALRSHVGLEGNDDVVDVIKDLERTDFVSVDESGHAMKSPDGEVLGGSGLPVSMPNVPLVRCSMTWNGVTVNDVMPSTVRAHINEALASVVPHGNASLVVVAYIGNATSPSTESRRLAVRGRGLLSTESAGVKVVVGVDSVVQDEAAARGVANSIEESANSGALQSALKSKTGLSNLVMTKADTQVVNVAAPTSSAESDNEMLRKVALGLIIAGCVMLVGGLAVVCIVGRRLIGQARKTPKTVSPRAKDFSTMKGLSSRRPITPKSITVETSPAAEVGI